MRDACAEGIRILLVIGMYKIQKLVSIDWVVVKILFSVGFGSLGGKEGFSDGFNGARVSNSGGCGGGI